MPPNEALDIAGNALPLTELLLRFLLDFVSIVILVRFIYYPLHKQKDYLFTFFLFNILIFIICAFLSSSRIKLGFAFGLFAIFSIFRYRTVTIPVKEMGYFFVCITSAVLNALVSNEMNYALLLGANALILGLVLVLDRYISINHENFKEIAYEKIELIKPQLRNELIADLTSRTGLPIHRVEVININFLRDTATIHAFYYANEIETAVK